MLDGQQYITIASSLNNSLAYCVSGETVVHPIAVSGRSEFDLNRFPLVANQFRTGHKLIHPFDSIGLDWGGKNEKGHRIYINIIPTIYTSWIDSTRIHTSVSSLSR
jgi:hypothetical protein